MDIKISTMPVTEIDVDTLLIYGFAGSDTLLSETATVDEAMAGTINDLLEANDFSGKSGQVSLLYPRGAIKSRRLLLIGLGERESFTAEDLRRAVAHGINKVRDLKSSQVATVMVDSGGKLSPHETARALAEGALLASYTYRGQKTENDDNADRPEALTLLIPPGTTEADIQPGIDEGSALARGAITARDLVNLPPNICTPMYMSSVARNIADNTDLRIEILDRQQMESLQMGALLAVAQGSDTPPRFIILEHNADRAEELDTIVLAGKGVTFDTGGYSLKSGEGMIGMKSDMGGAAAVIGAMHTIALLDVPLHVVGLAPASDNMISGKAYRPQEVITAGNGKTIEVISTDAEGRLLLADALVYAKRYNPQAVVDIATLTGSCVVALGHLAAGLFSIDDSLRDRLMQAADTTSERLWPLPLFPEYKKYLDSNTADMKNTGGRMNGVATAAMFLRQFVDFPSWAHIDMAGVMHDLADIPYVPSKGASGYGARLLAEFVRQWAE